jgi:hypothetical protein
MPRRGYMVQKPRVETLGFYGAKLRAVWAKCRVCEVGEASSPHFLSVSVLCPAGAIGLSPGFQPLGTATQSDAPSQGTTPLMLVGEKKRIRSRTRTSTRTIRGVRSAGVE